MTRLSLPGLLLAAALCGCSTNPGTEAPALPRAGRPVDPADRAAAAEAGNRFAFDLQGKLDAEGNLFFSPLSVFTALTMTSAGARGATAAEMTHTLHHALDAGRLHPAVAALFADLGSDGGQDRPRLYLANSLWAASDAPLEADFTNLMKENYAAGVHPVNFRAPEEARRAINAWVAGQTHDQVRELLQSGDVTADSRLVLASAIYFKGRWDHPFAAGRTQPGPFRVAADRTVQVPFMHQTQHFRYGEDAAPALQLLEMPYSGNTLSMVVLLPREVGGLAAVEKGLAGGALAGWLGRMGTQEVAVALPKLRLSRRYDLKPPLMALGMPSAFKTGKADFSGMSPEKDWYIQTAVHQATVDVNEEGTEATAATGVGIAKSPAPPPRPTVFHADRPFLFLIRHRETGCILFLGRVADPRG
jgi:serpin B